MTNQVMNFYPGFYSQPKTSIKMKNVGLNYR